MSNICKRKKFGEVLEAFGADGPGCCKPCVFPLPLEEHRCKPSQTPQKSLGTTQKNKAKWTLFIWLSLSGFWGWNVTICGIYETFFGITCISLRSTFANYKQWKSSSSVSNNWRRAASNPQTVKAHSRNFKVFPFHARIDSLSFFLRNKKAISFKNNSF